MSASAASCLGGNLYVGTLGDASWDFQNVIAVCANDLAASTTGRRIETLAVTDESTSFLLPHFDAALRFLRSTNDAERTIVACSAGQSRSVAVAVVCLLVALNATGSGEGQTLLVKDILATLKEERPSLHVNPGFLPQLMLAEELYLSKPGSTRHALAAARARLALQAYSRASRGAICNGFDMVDPIAADSEVKERPSCWLVGVCGRDVDPLFPDERWENIRSIPPASGKSCSSLFRPDTFAKFAAAAEIPSISRYLGSATTGEPETSEPRLWLSCTNCKGKLASDRNLVDINSGILRQLQEDAATELPYGSRPPKPEAATLTAPSVEAPYYFVEVMDWHLPPFVYPGESEPQNPAIPISRPVAAARAKVFVPKIAPSAAARSATKKADEEEISEPETEFSDYEPEGKLRCPCCGIKVGRYDWNGAWNGGEAFKTDDNDPERIMAQAVYECRNYNFISPAFALLKEAVRVTPAGGQVAPAISVIGGRAAAAIGSAPAAGIRAGSGASAAPSAASQIQPLPEMQFW
jgi:hypothetical protein